jgi:hypothetical protein
MTAELLFERRRPGHELEAEPIVNHGEAAGGEREALSISPGDTFAGGGSIERPAGLGGELLSQHFDFALAQRADQIAGEDEAACLPLRKTLVDEFLGVALQRLPHLGECLRVKAASTPSSTSCWRVRATVSTLVSNAAAISPSLHPGPAVDASAFNRMRAFNSFRAGCFPLSINVLS